MNKKTILSLLIILMFLGAAATFYYANKLVSGSTQANKPATTQSQAAADRKAADLAQPKSAAANAKQSSDQKANSQNSAAQKNAAGQANTGNGRSGGTGTAKEPTNQTIIYVKVIGKGGSRLFGPAGVNFPPGSKPDAITVLDKTGLSYHNAGNYIDKIQGESASGEYGWKYGVNGTAPNFGAGQTALNNGDKLIWWYGDIGSRPPAW